MLTMLQNWSITQVVGHPLSQLDLHGRVGCWKGGVFQRLEGLRVSIYDKDYVSNHDFMNSSISNKNGEFAIFAREIELERPDFYVWMALSCDFILREKIFAGCTNKHSGDSIQQQCMHDAAEKFILAERFVYIYEFKTYHECDIVMDIGKFSMKNITKDYAPQTQLLKETFQGNLGPDRRRCGIFYRTDNNQWGITHA